MSRVLVRSFETPHSTGDEPHFCDAFSVDGIPCENRLQLDSETWCHSHLQELKVLNSRLGSEENDAQRVEVADPDSAMQKVLKLRSAVRLRRQIRERYYPRSGDTIEFINWIKRLEEDLRVLVDGLASNPNRGQAQEEDEGTERGTILQRRARPQIHINTLSDDGTIRVLREFYTGMCTEGVRRLYHLVPDLDDSGQRSSSSIKDRNVHDQGTDIVRTWFRILVFNSNEAETLQQASKSNSIDEFLACCHASRLESFCDFFENAWRPHALQYLRVAICMGNPDRGDFKTISFLGGRIPTATEGLKLRMEKPCWDIMYQWFPRLLTPSTLANICSTFEEYTTVCRLLMLGLYREHWFDPQSVLTECTTGVYFGFIPFSKGDNARRNGLHKQNGQFMQRESRNYVCGQMAVDDDSAQYLLDELIRQSERVLVILYVGRNIDPSLHPMEEDLFISRRRTAKEFVDLENAEWTVNVSLEDVKHEIRYRQTSEDNPIVADSCHFIIIDKQVGLPFELFDIIRNITYSRRRSQTLKVR